MSRTKSKRRSSKPPAALPRDIRIIEADGASDFSLVEAADTGDEGPPKLRRFTMTAYTGGRLELPNFPYPVVVDLSGMQVPAKSRPILRDHGLDRIVGHTESIEVNRGSIRLAGVISGSNEHAREVTETAGNGFPWQASIGARADKVALVDEGEAVEVNGRRFTGPLYVARRSTLREVSFVALGADDRTSATLAATADNDTHDNEETELDENEIDAEFSTWLDEHGFDLERADETQATSLKAWYERETQGPVETVPAPTTTTEPPTTTTIEPPDTGIETIRAERAGELRRIEAIARTCGGEYPEIEAKAIEEGWDVTRTELEVLRASRPKVPGIHRGPTFDARTLEAAACLSAGIDSQRLLADYGERTLQAADPLRHIGLRELVAECARLEGRGIPRVFGDGRETIRAGFSTLSLPGILESVMQRTMLAAYEASPVAAFDLCSIGSVSDFKEVSRYRLLGTGGFEQVAPDGELKSGQLSEEKYTNRADTYGQILYLTRHDVVNDDLNAFLDIVRTMGRSGAETIDHIFFTLFLANPGGFFSAGNANYLAGAETAFGSDSLSNAKTLFRKQKAGPGSKKKDQKPINVRPASLVVPVELETEAELLMGSAQLMVDGSGTKTKIPVDNPHRNKYRVVSMPHLSDDYYTGSSTTAWYLFADPAVLPAYELVFLNGRRTPVVERIETPPNNLGMGFRGYIDVGVNSQNPRGAVKMKGIA